jgi:hypothetical protein
MIIAYSGYRWHDSLCHPEMLQILRFLTIRKGGVYVHWDALDARSEKTNHAKVLGKKAAHSHAHATRMHKKLCQGGGRQALPSYARRQKTLLRQGRGFRDHRQRSHHRPRSSCDAGDVRAADYRCIDSNIVVASGAPDRCAGLVGNYQAKVLFEQADPEDKGETTVPKNRMQAWRSTGHRRRKSGCRWT